VHWVHLATHATREASRRWDRPRRRLHALIQRASVWPHRVLTDAAVAETAQQVAAIWFDPLEEHLDGVDQLFVVLDNSNTLPPLDCLRGADGRLLLDRYVISTIPTACGVDALLSSPLQRRPPRERRALVIGDPRFDPQQDDAVQDDLRLALDADDMQLVRNATLSEPTLRSVLQGDAATLHALPRLPYSRREARRVAHCFRNATLWVGPTPTEQRLWDVLRSSPSFDYVHMATHALLDLQAPERSAIVLSAPDSSGEADPRDDGLLTMREIYLGWKLDADLVALSGCQTGQMTPNAGGYLGIAQAFLRAGVRSLLVSQWKVDDVATALLMGRFYENLTATGAAADAARGPMSKAHALTEAKRWLRQLTDADGRQLFAHPAYWAGFVLVGDPR
jgi:CHAT domain-containing protein